MPRTPPLMCASLPKFKPKFNHNKTEKPFLNNENKKTETSGSNKSNNPAVMQANVEEKTACSLHTNSLNLGIHQTPKAECIHGSNSRQIGVIFDNGSSCSFIEDLAKSLGLKPIKKQYLELEGISKKKIPKTKFNLYKVKLKGLKSNEIFEIEVFGLNNICNVSTINDPNLITELLKWNIDITDNQLTNQDKIQCLVGANYFWNFVKGRVIRTDIGYFGVETVLGMTVQGRRKENDSCPNILFSSCENSDDVISQNLQKFWEIEEIKVEHKKPFSNQVIQNYYNSIEYSSENRKYSVNLLWIEQNKIHLNSNYFLSHKRLTSILNRLRKDPDTFLQYNKTILDLTLKGFAHLVDENEFKKGKHYLPHKPVIKMDRETTKCRQVLDGSAKSYGKFSLNDCLCTGDNLNPDLFNLLLLFRKNEFAVCADISSAFHTINLKKENHSYTRFLWIDQSDLFNENPRIVEYYFSVVIFGLKCSTFLLASVIKEHLKKFKDVYPDTVEILQKSFYVDDICSSIESKSVLINFIKESRLIMEHAGMQLCKFKANIEISEKDI